MTRGDVLGRSILVSVGGGDVSDSVVVSSASPTIPLCTPTGALTPSAWYPALPPPSSSSGSYRRSSSGPEAIGSAAAGFFVFAFFAGAGVPVILEVPRGEVARGRRLSAGRRVARFAAASSCASLILPSPKIIFALAIHKWICMRIVCRFAGQVGIPVRSRMRAI